MRCPTVAHFPTSLPGSGWLREYVLRHLRDWLDWRIREVWPRLVQAATLLAGGSDKNKWCENIEEAEDVRSVGRK